MAGVRAGVGERLWLVVRRRWWVGAVWCRVCWKLLVLRLRNRGGGVHSLACGGRVGGGDAIDGGDTMGGGDTGHRLEVSVCLARLVVATDWYLWLALLQVSLALQNLQVSPEDVTHEEWGPGDEVLLVHGAELPPTHGQAGDEAVHV